jgi:hypothetical protein
MILEGASSDMIGSLEAALAQIKAGEVKSFLNKIFK